MGVWLAVVFTVVVYVLPLISALRPAIDADAWWHMAVGKWVVEHGTVPSLDPFSAYGQSRPWVAYSWIFGVLMYGVHAWLGLAGLLVLRVLLALAATAALHRLALRQQPRFLAASGLALVASGLISILASERPWLFTIIFGALTLEVILDLREGRRRWTFWALPVVYCLWANLHIQFIYGLFFLGLAGLAALLDRHLLRRLGTGQADTAWTPAWWRLFFLGLACTLATLLNPYGYRIYEVVLEYGSQPTPFRLIAELMSMNFRGPAALVHWGVLTVALVCVFCLGRKRDLSAFDVLLLAGAIFFCFRAQRDLWMVVLAALVLLPRLGQAEPDVRLSLAPMLLAGMLVLGLAGGLAWLKGLDETRLRQSEAALYPAQALDWLRQHPQRGPMYNHLNWGGYLIWNFPEFPVSMDGRTNLHGEERLQRSFSTWMGNGWRDDPELNQAGFVIAPVGWALTELLRLDPRFEKVYEDAVTVVFTRR